MTTSKDRKFNVIIPTRERADTLYHSLRTVVAQDYDNLNIIVSDNYSHDNTREVVASFSDSRITYVNTGERISMSHNWEFALSHVKEGWVTILGDDDGLLTGALLKIDEVIKKTDAQAVLSRWCHFTWPNSQTANAPLIIPMKSGFEIRSGREWLAKLMNGKAQYPDLPMLYTGGFVDVKVINRARCSTGAFYLSMVPDVYSAVALVSVLDSYVFLREPVALAGVSSHSTGASALSAGHNQEPLKKIKSENNIPFHKMLACGEVPRSISIAIYDSYLQSVHLHHDFLKIKLEDQLKLALIKADPHNYDDVRKYCERVASSNGIELLDVERKVNTSKKVSLVGRLIPLSASETYQTLSGRDFGVEDIHGAMILANTVLHLEASRGYWKLEMFLRYIKKIIKRLW